MRVTMYSIASVDDDYDDVWFQLDVNGECETKYVIHSKPSLDLSSVSNMVVTKVKNFDKCITRNSFEQGVFAGLPHRESDRVSYVIHNAFSLLRRG